MENELNPIEEKLVEIIASSDARGIRFTEIVALAKKESHSRASVARSLSSLCKRKIIKKNGVYRLSMEAIHWKHAQRSLFSTLAMHIFNKVVEDASKKSLSDDEFTKVFAEKIGTLAMFVILHGLSKAKTNSIEGGKWLEQAFGTLPQKYGWRVCVNRQIFGGPTSLANPVLLEKLPIPEIIVEDDVIYVKPPSTIEPGITARILDQLQPIPKKRLDDLYASLTKLFPKEVSMLNEVLRQINEASKISRIGGGRS
jgi:hypothetical protein